MACYRTVTDARTIHLEDLPAFEVQRITTTDQTELVGVFTHLNSVRAGRSWLYAGDAGSLIGDLLDLDATSRRARFIAPFWSSTSPIHVGTVAPWLDAYWQAYHVTMIVDPLAEWTRTKFAPSPAQHFQRGNSYGWTKAGQMLPDGAVPMQIDEVGWDHEHCELCQAKIGRGGNTHGYVDRNNRWLCERCYIDYAERRSLGFVFSI